MKKKKVWFVILFIITILVMGIFGYLIYGEITDKKSNNNDDNTQKNMEKNYNNWEEYLLDANIQNISIRKFKDASAGDDEDFDKTVDLDKNDLKDILSKIKDYSLIKTYSQGRGGIDNLHLTVNYKINDEDYSFQLYYNSISADTIDDKLLDLLNNSVTNVENEELANEEGTFYYFDLGDEYNNSLFDSYFE